MFGKSLLVGFHKFLRLSNIYYYLHSFNISTIDVECLWLEVCSHVQTNMWKLILFQLFLLKVMKIHISYFG